MTDITPGFTFSGGQLVTANNLNKVVGDAIINDESIDAVKLSEDSVSGAIMGHPTMARADVAEQDYILIYDTSESKIKKLAKLDLIGTLNIQFEGGVVSGVTGSQTTIDGSTGAIVMDSGHLTMNSGNIETNDVHVKGDLQVDGAIIGNIAYTGAISFGTAGTGLSTFANTDGALSMDADIETKYVKITGFDPASPQGSSGVYTDKYSLHCAEDIHAVGNIQCEGMLGNENFLNVGQVTFLNAVSSATTHMLTWSYTTSTGNTSSLSMPAIVNRSQSNTNQGIQFFILSPDTTKDTDYSFRGNIVWLYPDDRGVGQPVIYQMSAKDSSNTLHTWFLRAWHPTSSNTKVFEILPSNSATTCKVNIGGASKGANLDVYGTFSASGTKNFRIEHPVLEGKDLQHCSIEAPKGDLIYRGKYTLGTDPVNLDDNANMAEGTFVKLVKDVQVFVQNNAGWDRVKGRVEGNKLYIDCETADCTDEVDWLVIGERKDADYIDGENTDDNGNFITELDCRECTPECDECPDPDLPTDAEIVV